VKIGLVCAALLISGFAHADEAVYLMRDGMLPVPRAANGYVVEVVRGADSSARVRVESSVNPIAAAGTYAEVLVGLRPAVPDGFRLPAELRTDLRPEMTAWEAATSVLEWVTDNLELIGDDRRPQDAISVLGRGGGRCSGLANATAALLMGAGFEARTVSGLLVEGRRAIPHRWVECRLPGAGWVPTDPTLGWWIVTSGHIAFPDTVERAPRVEVVVPPQGQLTGLPRVGTTMVRPNEGAELVCRLAGSLGAGQTIISLQRGSERRQAVLGEEVRFADLLPGRWVLIAEIAGRVVERRELVLKEGVVHSYVVHLPFAPPEEVGS